MYVEVQIEMEMEKYVEVKMEMRMEMYMEVQIEIEMEMYVEVEMEGRTKHATILPTASFSPQLVL